MKKHELIEEVAARSGLTQAMTRRALDSLHDAVVEAVARGQDVMLAGLGKLVVAKRAARMGRNVRTGAPVPVPPGTIAKLRPSTSLQQAAEKSAG